MQKACFSLRVIFLSLLFASSQKIFAGGFFEVGQVTLNTTVDNGGFVTITPSKTFVNPVVIAGPITHNNDLTLVPRVNNAGGILQVGMQSPCENLGPAGGVTCPSPGTWVNETITYVIVEEGVWEFPDQTEIEADLINTNTVREAAPGAPNGNNAFDLITVQRTAFDSLPAVMHTVNSFVDTDFIASTVYGTGNLASVVTTTQFKIALEGLEAINTHGAEDLAWLAIEPANGSNAGINYNSGRTTNLVVDRHSDACNSLGHGDTIFLAHHNTMNGANGAVVRRCNATDGVHMDEDQVNDAERTGIPERVSWLSFDSTGFGNLVFLTATQTVVDDNGGLAEPNDVLTYTINITNQLNDFAQADNAGDELNVPLPANTTLVPGSLTESSGSFTGTGPLAWNGTVAANQTITLTYQVTVDEVPGVCDTDLDNQATLHMDPNGDGVNSIDELSDDTTRNDGIDSDDDNGSDNAGLADDDPTRIHVDCATLQIVKNVINDNGRTAVVGDFGIASTAGVLSFDAGTTVVDTTTYTATELVVPVGTYTLTETDVVNYTEGSWSCTAGSGLVNTFDSGSITLATGDTSICSISNNDDPLQADLSVVKTDPLTTYTPGNSFTYTITVNNAGPEAADGAVLTDNLPTWAEGVTWTCTASGGAVCPNLAGTGSISETIATLPNGGQLVYELNGNYSLNMSNY